jgi:PKHD-type hydroxylase
VVYDNKIKFSKGATGPKHVYDVDYSNHRDIAYVGVKPYSHWIYDILERCTLEANDSLFQFDINYVTDPLHYVIYPEPDTTGETGEKRESGGFLDWHMDIGHEEVNRRKLATIVLLSDPKDFEGGELLVWNGGNPYDPNKIIKVPLRKGDACVFPTFYMHQVTPVTKGERRALVYWTGGAPFK